MKLEVKTNKQPVKRKIDQNLRNKLSILFTLKHAEKGEPHLEEAVVRQEEEGNGSVR